MPSPWFRIRYAENALRDYLDAARIDPAGLRAPEALRSMLGFYRDTRGQHTSIRDRGDALLFQWGPDADGDRYTCDVVRQLVRAGGDAQPIVQVCLTLVYRWTPVRRELGRGQEWCFDPDEADGFAATIRGGAAYQAIASARPVEVLLHSAEL